MRIAITGISGDAGLGALKGIKLEYRTAWVLAIDRSEHDCAGFNLADASRTAPLASDPDYVPFLIDTLNEFRIGLLVPGIDSEIPILAEARSRIESNTQCQVLVANSSFVAHCSDKLKTAEWLETLDLPAPKTRDVDTIDESGLQHLSFPLIAKPRRGNGSKGVRTITGQAALRDFLAEKKIDYCLQEYVDGPEYTCGLLFDKEGELRDWICMERTLANGRTVKASTAHLKSIDELIKAFGKSASAIGAVNLQLRVTDDNIPYVFEINPRLSGSTAMRIAVGFNDPARMVSHWLLGQKISRAQIVEGTVYDHSTQLVVRPSPSFNQSKLPENVVFDCGDTLLELEPARELICRDVLQQIGVQSNITDIRRAYELVEFSLRQQASQLPDRAAKDKFYDQFNAMLAKALGIESKSLNFNATMQKAFSAKRHWMASSETKAFLQELHSRYDCYVLANWDTSLPEVLERAGILKYFRGVYSSGELGAEKPAPEIFTRFEQASSVSPDSAIYIGNEYHADAVGSRNAGFSPILLDRYDVLPNGIDCHRVTSWAQLEWLL